VTVVLVVVLVVVVVLVAYGIGAFNRLVRLRNRVDAAWSQIAVQLERRHDLIPNLVETVKGYAKHEQRTFVAVVKARSAAMTAQGPVHQAAAENMLESTLKSLFALAEAYPELKANQNFLALQEELTATEGRVAYARQFYNDSVMKLNTRTQTFPSSVLASMFHFTQREYFEVETEAARHVPAVSF
jgi:LemA protein